jgi:hypothetical protein
LFYRKSFGLQQNIFDLLLISEPSIENACSANTTEKADNYVLSLYHLNNSMKLMLPLRTLEYCIPLSAKSTRHVIADGEIGLEQPHNLLSVNIDFQSGQCLLEGNWPFIISSNGNAEKHWLNYHREWVRFKGTVYPGQSVDLAESPSGAAFAIEGMLSDGDVNAEYTGLLLLDPLKERRSNGIRCWVVSVYLYNTVSDDCEIKLKWMFYPAAKNQEWN